MSDRPGERGGAWTAPTRDPRDPAPAAARPGPLVPPCPPGWGSPSFVRGGAVRCGPGAVGGPREPGTGRGPVASPPRHSRSSLATVARQRSIRFRDTSVPAPCSRQGPVRGTGRGPRSARRGAVAAIFWALATVSSVLSAWRGMLRACLGMLRDAEVAGQGWLSKGRQGSKTGQWPRRCEGTQRPICDLAPLLQAPCLGEPELALLPAPHRGIQTLAEAANRGEVGLEAAVVPHDQRAALRHSTECSQRDRLMRSLPASPGANNLAADSSQSEASIPQDTSWLLAPGLVRSCRQPSPNT